MKFLLTQRLNYKKKHTLYYLYPNSFSRLFVNIAKRLDLIFDVKKDFSSGYYCVKRYEILENDFKRVYRLFKKKIEENRSKFYTRPYLEQIIIHLFTIFRSVISKSRFIAISYLIIVLSLVGTGLDTEMCLFPLISNKLKD